MRIYLPKFKNDKGKTKPLSRYYIDFKDHNGHRRRIAAFESKDVSRDFAGNLQTLVNRLQSGTAIEDSPELIGWMNRLSDDITARLVQWGLIPKSRGEALKPLKEHIKDYIAYLERQNLSTDYVSRTNVRLTAICNDCGFTTFRDIHPDKMETYLNIMKEKKYSNTSLNHYGDAMKSFLNWCVSRDSGCRLSGNPLATMEKEKRDSERKGVLTPEQFLLLVHKTVESNSILSGVNGRERGVLYLLAGSTGLRRTELLSLLWNDLRLDDEQPYVHARAAITKNSGSPSSLAVRRSERPEGI